MRALFNLPAPAKINWFLHVTGKRPDGYHTLQTVFQFIDWCDTLDLIQRDDGLIRRIGADELPQDDLCVRAARLLQQATQCESGVDIHLRKCIPQQAGLGGGSSDAATVLIGLNRLWRLDLPRAKLMQLALQLGADVPIFIYGRNAWAEGVGEQLQPIDLPTPSFAVVHPARGLSTRAVFSTLDLTTKNPEETIAGFAEWLGEFFAPDGRQKNRHQKSQSKNCQQDDQQSSLCPVWGRNDLQPGAEVLEPEVTQALQILRTALMGPLAAHSPTLRSELLFDARMTGSGSAVFALIGASDRSGLPSRHGPSDEVLGGLPDLLPEGWQGRLCEGLREHPLCDWIDA